jgi:hypothetical protein
MNMQVRCSYDVASKVRIKNCIRLKQLSWDDGSKKNLFYRTRFSRVVCIIAHTKSVSFSCVSFIINIKKINQKICNLMSYHMLFLQITDELSSTSDFICYYKVQSGKLKKKIFALGETVTEVRPTDSFWISEETMN